MKEEDQAIEIAEIKKDVKSILDIITELKTDCVHKDMCDRNMSSHHTDIEKVEIMIDKLWNEKMQEKYERIEAINKIKDETSEELTATKIEQKGLIATVGAITVVISAIVYTALDKMFK